MSIDLSLKITGNPFVDAGIFALKTKLNKNINEITIDDIKSESEKISKIYTKNAWQKNMHSIFPNSKLVNNSLKGKRDEEYFKFLNEFINNIEPIQEEGSCIACGCRDAKEYYGKSIVPLTGSGSLKNYFSNAVDGADYCPVCVLLIQFSPLVMYGSGDKFILLHSNSEKVMKFWAKNAIYNLDTQLASGNFTGCFNDGISNSINAIFEMIIKVIKSSELWEDENPSLNFYYFTNFNQGPDLEIYTLPTNVFNFLADIPIEDRNNWNSIINHGYINVNWSKIDGFDDYKNKANRIYINLMNNKSILKYFFNSSYKKVYCSWNLVKKYMGEVRNMDEKRIECIKNVGDKLAAYIKDNDSKNNLSRLEKASNYNDFRNVLRKILKNKIMSNDELLFTFDDYVINLFPEGNLSWRETQDLLLFRIYENLHDWMVEENYIDEYKDETKMEDE